MSEIITERLKNSIGSLVKIFLHNGFKFEGIITNCDEKYVEIIDDKIKGYKIIEIANISDLDVMNKEEKK